MYNALLIVLLLVAGSLAAIADEDNRGDKAEADRPEAVEHFGVGDAPIQTPEREVEEEPSAPVITDNDDDGVADEADLCPDTPEDEEVDRSGCPFEVGRDD